MNLLMAKGRAKMMNWHVLWKRQEKKHVLASVFMLGWVNEGKGLEIKFFGRGSILSRIFLTLIFPSHANI